MLAGLDNAPTRTEAAVASNQPIDPGMIIFGKLAELWRKDYVDREVGGKRLIAASTHSKYISHLENHILPRWKDTRLGRVADKRNRGLAPDNVHIPGTPWTTSGIS